MAEQIPYGVATSLINRLASAALREFGRIYGVMDQLESLKNTVESIKAVLLDADVKQEQSHAVQNWVSRLKDVLIPADDLLDEFFIQDMIYKRDEAHQNKVTKVLHSLSPNRITFRHKMAHEIEKIQKNFNDVVKDMSGLNLNPNVVVVQKTNPVSRETGSYVLESDHQMPRLDICNFSSLQHIKIIKCHNLALLPEGMPRLTNLRTLEIIGSMPILS